MGHELRAMCTAQYKGSDLKGKGRKGRRGEIEEAGQQYTKRGETEEAG
jgi:hypothetical protein